MKKRKIYLTWILIMSLFITTLSNTTLEALSYTIKVLVEPTLVYDEIYYSTEGFIRVEKNKKYGFIDKTGKLVISIGYEDAGTFEEGLAAVKKNGKWGYIDKIGKVVIPMVYDNVRSFEEGLTAVKKNEKWGMIDKKGNIVIPIIYSKLWWSFDERFILVNKDNKNGLIDKKTRKIVVPIEYDVIESFDGEIAEVKKMDYVVDSENDNYYIGYDLNCNSIDEVIKQANKAKEFFGPNVQIHSGTIYN